MACQDDFEKEIKEVRRQILNIRRQKTDAIRGQAFKEAAKFRRQETWLVSKLQKLEHKMLPEITDSDNQPVSGHRVRLLEMLVERLEARVEELERQIAFGD